jgi:hypothetical protein
MKNFDTLMMVFFVIGAMLAMPVMGYNLLGAIHAPTSADMVFHLQAAGIMAVTIALALFGARLAEKRSLSL